jgi:hypothetical protein
VFYCCAIIYSVTQIWKNHQDIAYTYTHTLRTNVDAINTLKEERSADFLCKIHVEDNK